MKDKQFILHLSSLTGILLIIGWYFTSYPIVFFSSDSGLRFLQIQQLLTQYWQSFAIDYPFQNLDPEWQHVPYYYAFVVIDNNLFLEISPFFPLIASLFYYFLGEFGLPFVPVLGGVASAWGTYNLGRLVHVPHPKWLFWATVLATPLLFYSIQLWDHSLATALSVWSLYFIAKGIVHKRTWMFVPGGLLLGLSLGQRPEMYVFAIAVAAGMLWAVWLNWRAWAMFLGGGFWGVAPLWWLQYQWVGHPLGLPTASALLGYGRLEQYAVIPNNGITITRLLKISRFLTYVESRDTVTFLATLLVAVGTGIVFLGLYREHKSYLAVGLPLASGGYLLFILRALQVPLTGLMTTFPLFVFSLIPPKFTTEPPENRSVHRLIGVTTVVFLIIMLTIWPAYGGKQWGARYLLPAYPLLLLLAFWAYTTLIQMRPETDFTKLVAATANTLLICSVLLQLTSLYLFNTIRQEGLELIRWMDSVQAEVVITNSPFVPSALTSLDKDFLFVRDDSALATVIARFPEEGIEQFMVASLTEEPLSVPDQVGELTVTQIAPFVYQLEQP